MKDFKLLNLPLSEDRIQNTIDYLSRQLPEDETGDYVLQLVEVLLDYFKTFPYSESVELNRAECRLGECMYWLEKFYSSCDDSEESTGED